MALVIEVAPTLPVKVTASMSLLIKTTEKGGDWEFTASYVDADGVSYGKPQTFILNPDGVTLNEKKGNGKPINWQAPADGDDKMAAAIAYCQAVLTAIDDAGGLTP